MRPGRARTSSPVAFTRLVAYFRHLVFSAREPLLNTGICEIIRHAENEFIAARLESDSTLFDEEKARTLVDSSRDKLLVAVDDASLDASYKTWPGPFSKTVKVQSPYFKAPAQWTKRLAGKPS